MNDTLDLGMWQAPPFDQLRYDNNCTAAANYFADTILYKTDNPQNHFLDGTKSANLGNVMIYLDSLLNDSQKPFRDPGAGRGQYALDLMSWYFSVWKNQTYYNSADVRSAYNKFSNQSRSFGFTCGNRAICDKLEVNGDPDVSGKGIVFVYFILAALTTIYFVFLTMDRLIHLVEPPLQHEPVVEQPRAAGLACRIIRALQHTVDGFLDSTLIFAVAMLAATVYRYLTWLFPREDLTTDEIWTYTLLGSAMMSTFSVFPCLVLQPVVKKPETDGRRVLLWTIVVGLAIVVEVAFQLTFRHLYKFIQASEYLSEAEDQPGFSPDMAYWQFQEMFNETGFHVNYHRMNLLEFHCTSRYHVSEVWKILLAGFSFQAVSFAIFLSVSIFFSHRLNECKSLYESIRGRPRLVLKILRLLLGVIYLVMCWYFLARFFSHRRTLKTYAPSTDQDSDWGFGQILALATWVPDAVDAVFEFRRCRGECLVTKPAFKSLHMAQILVN
ncbi:hypothetical protein LQW54_013077 [Pestalotiopsis sp. IQ-011]